MYPMLCDGVTLYKYRYSGSPELFFCVRTPNGQEYDVSRDLFHALCSAYGTKPLPISDPDGTLLNKLIHYGIVHTSRIVKGENLNSMLVLFSIGRRIKKPIEVFKVLNALLPILTVISILCMGKNYFSFPPYGEISWLLVFLMVAFSVVFHEIGHFVAAVSNGYFIYDAGLLLLGIIPVGAYIRTKEKNTSPLRATQFCLAGVEMNLVLAGLFAFLGVNYFPHLTTTLLMVSHFNFLLSITNLLPIRGFDGEGVLSSFFGFNIGSVSQTVMKKEKNRLRFWRAGIVGKFALFLMAIVYYCKPVVIIALISYNVIVILLSI